MSIYNIPSPATGICAYTTTFIINQRGSNKGYIRGISINSSAIASPEFIGGLPTTTASTSTIIQTITAVISSNGAVYKTFTNATVCSGSV
jgi:hypothetical protein